MHVCSSMLLVSGEVVSKVKKLLPSSGPETGDGSTVLQIRSSNYIYLFRIFSFILPTPSVKSGLNSSALFLVWLWGIKGDLLVCARYMLQVKQCCFLCSGKINLGRK